MNGQESNDRINQQPDRLKPQEMSEENQEDSHIHWISNITIKACHDQLLWRVNRRGCTAPLNQEVPEGPEQNNSTCCPKWEGEVGKESCFELWSSAQKYQRNITCNHSWSHDKK